MERCAGCCCRRMLRTCISGVWGLCLHAVLRNHSVVVVLIFFLLSNVCLLVAREIYIYFIQYFIFVKVKQATRY